MRSSLVAKGDFAYELKKVENQWYPMLSVPHLKRKFLTLNFLDFLGKKCCQKNFALNRILTSQEAFLQHPVVRCCWTPTHPWAPCYQATSHLLIWVFQLIGKVGFSLKGTSHLFFRFFQPIGKLPFSYKGASHLFFQLEKIYAKSPCSPRVDHLRLR